MRSHTSLALLCLCGLFLFALTSADQVFNPVPLVVFGTNGVSSQHLETISPSQVQTILTNAVSSNKEVVLLFVEPRLTTEQLWETTSFSHLKELIKEDSTVYPYVSAESGLASSIEKVAASLSKEANIFLSGTTFSSDITVQPFNRNALLARLKKNSEIYTNGVTDLVIVFFDSKTDSVFINSEVDDALASDDEYIDAVFKVVSAKTNGNFIAVLTADKPFLSQVSRVPAENTHRFAFQLRDTNITVNGTYYHSYWPIQILEIYIAAAVILFIAFLGVLCTCNLQSPQRFESPKSKKE